MKDVVHRVHCNGGMHRIIMGDAGISFPDHPGIWEEAQQICLMLRMGTALTEQYKNGCIAVAMKAKLGKDAPKPKVGLSVVDLMSKRQAVRRRLQEAVEAPEPAEKLAQRLRHEVLLTLKRCSYKHKVSKNDQVVVISSLSWGSTNETWVATYAEDDWTVRVQTGWLTQVYGPGRAVVDGKFIAAIHPIDETRVLAIYECTNKDPWPGAKVREAHIEGKKLVWV